MELDRRFDPPSREWSPQVDRLAQGRFGDFAPGALPKAQWPGAGPVQPNYGPASGLNEQFRTAGRATDFFGYDRTYDYSAGGRGALERTADNDARTRTHTTAAYNLPYAVGWLPERAPFGDFSGFSGFAGGAFAVLALMLMLAQVGLLWAAVRLLAQVAALPAPALPAGTA